MLLLAPPSDASAGPPPPPRSNEFFDDLFLFGCAGTDSITLSITLSAYPIIAPREMTEYGFIVINVVKSLRLCLRVVTSTDAMLQSRNLDRYTILWRVLSDLFKILYRLVDSIQDAYLGLDMSHGSSTRIPMTIAVYKVWVPGIGEEWHWLQYSSVSGNCKLSLGFSCVVDLGCGKGCEGFVLSKAKGFKIRGTADGSVPCLERRAAEYVSWIRKRVINPSALVRGASRNVSCDIATMIER